MNYSSVFGGKWTDDKSVRMVRRNGYVVFATDDAEVAEVKAYVDESGWAVAYGGFAGNAVGVVAKSAATLSCAVPDGYKPLVQQLTRTVVNTLAKLHGW